MNRNPPSEGFKRFSRGSQAVAYRSGDRVESIVMSDQDGSIDACKDILIDSRKICDTDMKKYLPDISRKRIDNDLTYEFVYEMPFYHTLQVDSKYTGNILADMLLNDLCDFNRISPLNSKQTTFTEILHFLRNNTWKHYQGDQEEVNIAIAALSQIFEVARSYNPSTLIPDIKPFNLAIDDSGNLIFLDPILALIPVKQLIETWEKQT